MNILYLSNARMPTEKAHGIQIIKMCQVLAQAGHEVELVLPSRHNYTKKTSFEYYGIKENFKIKKFFCLDSIVLDKYLGHLGLWIENITFFISVFPYIIFKKSDVVYTRDKLLLVFSLFKNNLIFEAHTLPRNYFLYGFFLNRLSGMVAITQGLKDFFIKKGMSSDKVLVAPDGVDLQEFDIKDSKEDCRRKLNLPPGRKIVLYTGHFYDWKGVSSLLEATKQLNEVLFLFVGGTKEGIYSFLKESVGFNNVMVVGYKPHFEIPFWLKAADILVLPNSSKEEISKYWTSPMKAFEYMASRKPIVVSDLPSIREVFNEQNSVLVEPDNSEAICRGIKMILADDNLAERIASKAFQDVQNYTWRERVGKICIFIKNSLKL